MSRKFGASRLRFRFLRETHEAERTNVLVATAAAAALRRHGRVRACRALRLDSFLPDPGAERSIPFIDRRSIRACDCSLDNSQFGLGGPFTQLRCGNVV